MESWDSKKLFSSRVENYVKYRPGYPVGVVETLRDACGLTPESQVADVGSGTGLLARLFLDYGCRVYGVEPNPEMRAAGDRLLAHYQRFSSLPGSAEQTGLPTAAVDFVTVGQAFHWFALDLAREEFIRILKPEGWVALVWNERRFEGSPLQRAYEELLHTYCPNYERVNHRNVQNDVGAMRTFFGGPYQVAHYDNGQVFDYDGLKGRLLSSSYAPDPGDPQYEPMLAELRRIFDAFQKDGTVTMDYNTQVFYGRLAR
jgi:SAM-dependent methyltransferase